MFPPAGKIPHRNQLTTCCYDASASVGNGQRIVRRKETASAKHLSRNIRLLLPALEKGAVGGWSAPGVFHERNIED